MHSVTERFLSESFVTFTQRGTVGIEDETTSEQQAACRLEIWNIINPNTKFYNLGL